MDKTTGITLQRCSLPLFDEVYIDIYTVLLTIIATSLHTVRFGSAVQTRYLQLVIRSSDVIRAVKASKQYCKTLNGSGYSCGNGELESQDKRSSLVAVQLSRDKM